MSGLSNGGSFQLARPEPRWPVPPWKFGLRLNDDRGDI
jgi:hypothetical protein